MAVNGTTGDIFENIDMWLDSHSITTPVKKSKGKWFLRGSSMIDSKNKRTAYLDWLWYVSTHSVLDELYTEGKNESNK